MKWKKAIRELYNCQAQVFCDLLNRFEEYSKKCALYNEIHKISSRACAECIDDAAKRIASQRAAPFLETYSEIVNEAIAMLLSGKDEASVVWHFEKQADRCGEWR